MVRLISLINMKGFLCVCGSRAVKRTKEGIICSKCGKMASKTAFSLEANKNLAKLFNLKDKKSGYPYDCVDKRSKVYELKTTTHIDRFNQLKKSPFSALSKGQRENINSLDYILIGLADWRTFKIKKFCLVRLHHLNSSLKKGVENK